MTPENPAHPHGNAHSSERQAKGNRRNAQKSTGPRTEEGKKKVARNSTRHGVYAQSAIPIGHGHFVEDAGEIQAYVDSLTDSLGPRDRLEQELARQIGLQVLRLRRLERLEVASMQNDSAVDERVFTDLPDREYAESVAAAAAKVLRDYIFRVHSPTPEEFDVLIELVLVEKGWNSRVSEEFRRLQEKDPKAALESLLKVDYPTPFDQRRFAQKLLESLAEAAMQSRADREDEAGARTLTTSFDKSSQLVTRLSRELERLLQTYDRLQRRVLTVDT
jgi:hypothetical protein